MNNTNFNRENADPDDIDEVLTKIEKSLGFKFGRNELKDRTTFGQLCDIVVSKMQANNSKECTTQQAFYKLRNFSGLCPCYK